MSFRILVADAVTTLGITKECFMRCVARILGSPECRRIHPYERKCGHESSFNLEQETRIFEWVCDYLIQRARPSRIAYLMAGQVYVRPDHLYQVLGSDLGLDLQTFLNAFDELTDHVSPCGRYQAINNDGRFIPFLINSNRSVAYFELSLLLGDPTPKAVWPQIAKVLRRFETIEEYHRQAPEPGCPTPSEHALLAGLGKDPVATLLRNRINLRAISARKPDLLPLLPPVVVLPPDPPSVYRDQFLAERARQEALEHAPEPEFEEPAPPTQPEPIRIRARTRESQLPESVFTSALATTPPAPPASEPPTRIRARIREGQLPEVDWDEPAPVSAPEPEPESESERGLEPALAPPASAPQPRRRDFVGKIAVARETPPSADDIALMFEFEQLSGVVLDAPVSAPAPASEASTGLKLALVPSEEAEPLSTPVPAAEPEPEPELAPDLGYRRALLAQQHAEQLFPTWAARNMPADVVRVRDFQRLLQLCEYPGDWLDSDVEKYESEFSEKHGALNSDEELKLKAARESREAIYESWRNRRAEIMTSVTSIQKTLDATRDLRRTLEYSRCLRRARAVLEEFDAQVRWSLRDL